MKNLGSLFFCLGVQVIRNRKVGIFIIYQVKYIREMLKRFNMSLVRLIVIFLAVGVKLF